MTGSPVVESEGRDILSVEGLSLSFGGLAALADVDLTVREGSITGIIGPNGAGQDQPAQLHLRLLPAAAAAG